MGAGLGVIVGLTAGNIIYQMMMASPDYTLALDRSFFQAVAIATLGLTLALRGA